MRCKNPFVRGRKAFGCGQCLPCRIKRRRVWTHRMMLEAALRKDNAFVTLTYDDEHLPADLSVSPRELQLFLKRLRKAVSPLQFRYFGVGEYGDETERPHYHLALFGYPVCSNYGYVRRGRPCGCYSCDPVRSAWGRGHILVGELTRESAAYVAGYVTKKMTGEDDERLHGRHPEFARMSLRPGIGAQFMPDIASELLRFEETSTPGALPYSIRHGRSEWPLGRYLRNVLRQNVGISQSEMSDQNVSALEEAMLPMWLAAHEVAKEASVPVSIAFRNALQEEAEGKIIRMQLLANRKRKKVL